MADIFEKDYFEKRRRAEGAVSVKKGKMTKFLKLKKKKMSKDESLDFNKISEKESSVNEPVSEGIYDAKKPTQKKSSEWRNDFLKANVSGFSGGFIIFIFLLRYIKGFSLDSIEFWGGILLVLILAFIVFLVFSLILTAMDR